MQDEHLGFWSFPILFQVLHYTGNSVSTGNQAFIRNIWENQVLQLFLWALETKHHSYKYNCSLRQAFKCQR